MFCVSGMTYKGLNNFKAQERLYIDSYWKQVSNTDKESEAELTKRKADKRRGMSRFNAELRQQAGDEVQTVRELNTEKTRIIEWECKMASLRANGWNLQRWKVFTARYGLGL
jgi:hypothetical protein